MTPYIKSFKSLLLLVLLTVASISFASSVIQLSDKNKVYPIHNQFFTAFEDTSSHLTFNQVLELDDQFKKTESKFFKNEHYQNAYWYKYKIKNDTKNINSWLIVSYNYSIKEIDVYVVDKNQHVVLQPHEEAMDLADRLIFHKQPVFYLDIKPNEEVTVYIRTVHNSHTDYTFAIYSSYYFSSYFFNEYFWFGMFYGILAFVSVFGLICYFLFSDRTQLFFMFLVLSQAFFMLFRDGNGLVFIIPHKPEMVEIMKNISRLLFSSSIIFYCSECLKLKKESKYFKLFAYIFVSRTLLFFLSFLYPESIFKPFEFIVITICFAVTYLNYKKGNTTNKHLVFGLGIVWICFVPYFLNLINVLDYAPLYFFALYYGIIFELIFLMIATGENVVRLRKEAYHKELINKELETQVKERTRLLEMQKMAIIQKSNDMNDYLYRASHDIKGPIRSIKGLTELGKEDDIDKNQYFDLINATADNLNVAAIDLINYIKLENTNELDLKKTSIEEVYGEVAKRFEGYPNFEKIKIETDFVEEALFETDKKLFVSVFQNLFENSIKYMDLEKPLSRLTISAKVTQNQVVVNFEDNGLGISENMLPKIFDKFYKNSTVAGSTGLGLYIVKNTVEKLGGNIELKSKKGIGTIFTLTLPNPSKTSI